MEQKLSGGRYWDNFEVTTSPDGLLRTYCWGGDIPRKTACIFQCHGDDDKTNLLLGYKTFDADHLDDLDMEKYNYYALGDSIDNLVIKMLDDGVDYGLPWENRNMVSSIYQMDTDNGRVYLVLDYEATSSINEIIYEKECRKFGRNRYDDVFVKGEQSIIACIINNGTLWRIPIFVVDGKKQSRLTCQVYTKYTSGDSFLTIKNNNEDASVTFDETNKTITIKQYEEELDEKGHHKRLNDLVLKFDGLYFREVE